jgi:hypothetical protein
MPVSIVKGSASSAEIESDQRVLISAIRDAWQHLSIRSSLMLRGGAGALQMEHCMANNIVKSRTNIATSFSVLSSYEAVTFRNLSVQRQVNSL